MASYRYERSIDPDSLVPEAPRVYTRRERIRNWLDYNGKWVPAALAALVLLCVFAHSLIAQKKPDCTVALITPEAIPDSSVAALETALAGLCGDTNGDGEALVTVNLYQLAYRADGASDDTVLDAYQIMSAQTRLAGDVDSGAMLVYLLYDPDGFQAATGILARPDGTLPDEGTASGASLCYAWAGCPAAAALSAGQPELAFLAERGYALGRAGAWKADGEQKQASSVPLWNALTAGAKG